MFSIAGDATLSSINLSRVGGEDSDYTLVIVGGIVLCASFDREYMGIDP